MGKRQDETNDPPIEIPLRILEEERQYKGGNWQLHTMVKTPRQKYQRNANLQVFSISHRPNEERGRSSCFYAIRTIAKCRKSCKKYQESRPSIIGKRTTNTQKSANEKLVLPNLIDPHQAKRLSKTKLSVSKSR